MQTSKIQQLTTIPARPLLRPHALHSRAKETLVPRPIRRALRLCSCLLLLPEGPSPGRAHLWHRRGVNGLSHYQDHGPASTTTGGGGVQEEGCEMGQQARVLELALGRC